MQLDANFVDKMRSMPFGRAEGDACPKHGATMCVACDQGAGGKLRNYDDRLAKSEGFHLFLQKAPASGFMSIPCCN